MAYVTVQILEGIERGRVFANLVTPITIGREDENDIQLNDERVSRFHAKLQEDSGRIILTDLDSTNGTRVNGHPVQMHILREGDILAIGRCILLYGSPHTAPSMKTISEPDDRPTSLGDGLKPDGSADPDGFAAPIDLTGEGGEMFPQGPPELPQDLRALQRAQLVDLLAYIHDNVGHLANEGVEVHDAKTAKRMLQIPWESRSRLINLQAQLSFYLKQLSDPAGE
jgi:FHA domain